MIKAIRKPPGCKHVCYCHTPSRYLWEQEFDSIYLRNPLAARLFRLIVAGWLKSYDRKAAEQVDHFICNSAYVAGRIQRAYQHEAAVIHPGVPVERFDPHHNRDEFYLVAGELTPYKRMDLAIAACAALGRTLLVVGDGPERKRLERISGVSTRFLGRVSGEKLKHLLQTCRALLFPQVEDFGMVAVEAQAAGAPVLAYGQGGALEIVRDGRTGLFFHEAKVESLAALIRKFEQSSSAFDSLACAENALRFSIGNFRGRLKQCLARMGVGQMLRDAEDGS